MEESFEKKLQSISDWLGKEYLGIRTGQATPSILDSVKVEQYGALMALNQVGSVGIEDARTLRVAPWDAGNISNIERAIKDADLGVSVVTDSSGLRIIFPELTSERRAQLLKLAKSKLEDARVSVRAARDEAIKSLDLRQKSGELSEDAKFAQKERLQRSVDETNKKLEGLYETKKREIQQ